MRFESRSLLRSGGTQSVEYAEPRWRGEFVYFPMGRAEFQRLQAWLDTLRGAGRTFYGYDQLKPFPVSYPGGFGGLARAGGGAFDGTGTVSLLSGSGFTVSTLPSGLMLKAGDMVGLVEGAKRGLFRLSEDATANEAGVVALSVEPRIPPGQSFSSAAIANFVRPACVMTLDPQSARAPRKAGGLSPISFTGIEKLA
jgi:hypothetical protein